MRRTHRPHDVGTRALSPALGAAPPPGGGIDLDLPGNAGRLAATRWPGRGEPVVLLHGLSSQRRFWNLVAAHLDGFPLLALDQRGHGDSDRPDDDYALEAVAGDIGVAMDALGWSRAVLVGHSWGAAVAATFAVAQPQRSLSLVCVDGGFTSPPAGFDRAAARKRLEPPRIAMAPDELLAMMRAHAPTQWNDELAAAVLPIFELGADGLARPRLPFDVHMRIVESLLDYSALATIEQVRCPTWLVSCEPTTGNDEWAALKRAALDQVSGLRSDVRVMRWAGAVHDVPLQWPALVAGLVRTAVADAAGTGGTDA